MHISLYKGGKYMATKKATSTKKSKTTTSKKPTTKKVETIVTTEVKPVKKLASTKPKKAALFQSRSALLGASIGEFIGTFMLVAVALATQANPLIVSFALVAIVLTIGTLSGAHVNPLITVGAWATRKISHPRAGAYLLAQTLGGMLALVVMSRFAELTAAAQDAAASSHALGLNVPQLFKVQAISPDTPNIWYIVFAELLATIIFGFVVASAMRETRDRTAQAFTIGFGLLVALTIAGGAAVFAGGAVLANPAVALGVQAIDWTNLGNFWPMLTYIAMPLFGGVVGFFLYDVLRTERDEDTTLQK